MKNKRRYDIQVTSRKTHVKTGMTDNVFSAGCYACWHKINLEKE